ncbi:MAG: SGNH/GDSL hydrolase family protein [Terrimicrobiaceae bacterium]|nr:SGNH/GDSL hydrolase family protein [Terrimicrobiaceae bacterium]
MSLDTSNKPRWLFIADSITDYRHSQDPEGLGLGYVRMIQQWLAARGKAPEMLNRGISGDTVRRLAARWAEDVIDLKPDMLSVKIGVDDVWALLHPDRRADGVPIDEFHGTYDHCLATVRERMPDCELVLCEPCGIWSPVSEQGNVELQPYLEAIRSLSEKYRARALVKLHAAFLDAIEARPEIDWVVDGIHPSPPGDILIAHAWMKASGNL